MTYHIKHGGTLQIGDFIAVNKKYRIDFGWYTGNGRTGTLQYVKPLYVTLANDRFEKGKSVGFLDDKVFKNGLALDHIAKEFVKHKDTDMVVKINDATGLFTGKDLELYEEAREILRSMRVIKHETL